MFKMKFIFAILSVLALFFALVAAQGDYIPVSNEVKFRSSILRSANFIPPSSDSDSTEDSGAK